MLTLLVTTTFVACQKHVDNSNDFNAPFITSTNHSWSGDKGLIQQLVDFYTKTHDDKKLLGDILIQKHNSRSDGKFDMNTTVNAYIKSDSNAVVSLSSNDGTSYILEKYSNGNFSIRNSHEEKFKLYGKTVNVESKKGVTFRSDTIIDWNTSLYIPQSLVVTCFNEPDLQISKNTGKNITWIPDNNSANDKGVIIRLTYNPLYEKLFPNTGSLSNTDFERLIVVKDNGSYQLTAADLSDFQTPLNGLEITLFRGNFRVTGASNQAVAFCVFDFFKANVKLIP